MSEFDHLDIDGKLLRLLLAVLEHGSVTRAAQQLDVTQSAVSHQLDKLRNIVGDPLFVKAGRGIVATARAEALAVRARALLDDLRRFADPEQFDPSRAEVTLTVAANDLQRDLLLPGLLKRLRDVAPGLRLAVIPSGVPTAQMLRDERCQLVLSPRPPDGSDIVQKRLFTDRYLVFFDGSVRAAPRSSGDYLGAEHVTVVHEDGRRLDVDQWLERNGVTRNVVAVVQNFAGIASFVRGSRMIATMPGLLRCDLLRDLAHARPPIAVPEMPMYAVWHRRHHLDPFHQWVRRELDAVAAAVAGAAGRPGTARAGGGEST